MFENKYILKKIVQPTSDLVLLDLISKNGEPIFAYRPGQYVMISYRNEKGQLEEKHSFSIASSPTEQGVLRLGIRVMGRFTQGLVKLKPNTEILVYGPFGTFSFNELKHQSAVFLAGGIGITPFLSALKYATDKKLPNQLSLLYSNRSLNGTAFFDDLKKIEAANPNTKMLFSVTDEKASVNMAGVITERFCSPILKDFIGSTKAKTFFLCGPVPFMNGMKNCLLELGATEEQILMEEFSMLSNRTLFSRVRYVMAMTGYGALAALLPFYMIYASSAKPDNQSATVAPSTDVAGQNNEANSIIDAIIERLPTSEEKAAGDEARDEISGVMADETIKGGSALDRVAAKVVDLTRTKSPVTTKVSQPKPTTVSSIPTNETKPSAATKTQTATPNPTTSASGAPLTTTTPKPSSNTTVPNPTTSASGVVTSAPGSGSVNTPASTVPMPTTSASGVTTGGTVTGSTSAVPTTLREEDDD